MHDLVTAGYGALGALVVAVFTLWLTERIRNKSDERTARAVAEAVLAAQCDALLLALFDLRAAAMTNRMLWEGPAERWRSFLLALLAATGGYSRPPNDAAEWRRMGSAAGEVARALAADRLAVRQRLTALNVESSRLAAASVPLYRHSNARLRAAVDAVVTSATSLPVNEDQLDRAVGEFGRAVRALLPSWMAPPAS
jgi:hypothetical protein